MLFEWVSNEGSIVLCADTRHGWKLSFTMLSTMLAACINEVLAAASAACPRAYQMPCTHGCQTVLAQSLLLKVLLLSVAWVGVGGGGDQGRSTQVSAELMQMLDREEKGE